MGMSRDLLTAKGSSGNFMNIAPAWKTWSRKERPNWFALTNCLRKTSQRAKSWSASWPNPMPIWKTFRSPTISPVSTTEKVSCPRRASRQLAYRTAEPFAVAFVDLDGLKRNQRFLRSPRRQPRSGGYRYHPARLLPPVPTSSPALEATSSLSSSPRPTGTLLPAEFSASWMP